MAVEDLGKTCEKIAFIVNKYNSNDIHLNFGMPNWQANEAILDALENLERKFLFFCALLNPEYSKGDPASFAYQPEIEMDVLVNKYMAKHIHPGMTQPAAMRLVLEALKRMDSLIETQKAALKYFGKEIDEHSNGEEK